MRIWPIGFALLFAAAAHGAPVTYGHDSMRTGWYPDQPALTPGLVSGGSFGKLWQTQVNGQVYAQPLVFNGVLLVVTEKNWIYGLDPATGAVIWSRSVGTPFNPNDIKVGSTCFDIAPTIGITGTPVIDDTTGIAYFVNKTYANGTADPAALFLHAVDLATGAEQPNFPVTYAGQAQNDPTVAFNPTLQLQRPGLLLLGGVVYAGFSGHCDFQPYQGWVAGVSTAGQLTALWTDRVGGGSGAGIWMAGSGLLSDRAASIVFSTGNAFGGGSPTGSIAGSTPPRNLGESVVRLSVQGNGTLKATDFFTPSNANVLDNIDGDLGSAAPVGLPPAYFGTPATPRLIVQAGKEGYVYLLNADSFGGVGQGRGTPPDAVVARLGPFGAGSWSHSGIWPGDGGFIHLNFSNLYAIFRYGLNGAGVPTLTLAASAYNFGFSSGAPIVTSNGAQTGSGLVWMDWMADASGANAQLRAYDAVPVNGMPNQRFSAPIGTASKFAVPGVSAGRVFVGTRDSLVIAFGAPISAVLSGAALAFPATSVGQASLLTETVTAGRPLTISAVDSSSAQFVIGQITPPLPASLGAGQMLAVQVLFTPTHAASNAATLTITSDAGALQEGLSGAGLFNGAQLSATPGTIDFGSIAIGTQLTANATLTDTGSADLTVTSSTLPAAPFAVAGLPAVGDVLAASKTAVATVTFSPLALGTFADDLVLASTGGTGKIHLVGVGTPPGSLSISPLALDFGTVDIGTTRTLSFKVSNSGGTALNVSRSKPTSTSVFLRAAELFEGTSIAPGASVTIPIEFAPTAPTAETGGWSINSDSPGGLQSLVFTGTGRFVGYVAIPDPVANGWQVNGTAQLSGASLGSLLELTAAQPNLAGSAFWPAPIGSAGLDVSFLATLDTGTGGNGLALVLGDAAGGAVATSLGATGSGLGFDGIPGLAVALVTAQSAGDPSDNFVGVRAGASWLATATLAQSLRGPPHLVRVQYQDGSLAISVDGSEVLAQAVTLPPQLLIGFSAATGAQTDRHGVSDVTIRAGVRLPSPVVTLTPADRAAVAGAVTVTAQVAAASGTTLASLQLGLDGAVLAQGATSPLTLVWDSTGVANGPHLLVASAAAADGLDGSASSTIVVFNPPRVSVVAPARAQGVVAVQVNASPPLGTTLSSLTLAIDGVRVAAGASPLAFAWDTTALANGSAHSLVATATDADGSSSTSLAVSPLIANPPQVSVSAPALNAVLAGVATLSAAAVAPSGGAVASTSLLVDGTLLSTAPGAHAQSSWDTTTVPNGAHAVTASALDADGASASSPPIAVVVRNAPAVAVVSPAAGATVSGTPTLIAAAAPPAGTRLTALTLLVDGVVVATGAASPLLFAWPTAQIVNGLHAVTATATSEDGGAATSAPAMITVHNDLSLVLAPGARTLTAGGLGQSFEIIATFTGAPIAAALSVTGLQPGVTSLFSTPALDASGTSTLTLAAGAQLAPGGPFPFTVHAGEQVAQGSYTVVAPGSVAIDNLGFDPATGGATFSVSAASASGLAALQLYDGDALIASSATSPLHAIWDTRLARNGLHTLLAVAIDSSGTSTTTALEVPVLNEFTLTAPSTVALAPGGPDLRTPIATVAMGAAEPITLSAAGLPPGVLAVFSPNPVLAGKSATITWSTTAGVAAVAAAPVTLKGTSASVGPSGHASVAAVTVAAPGAARAPPAAHGCSSSGGGVAFPAALLFAIWLRKHNSWLGVKGGRTGRSTAVLAMLRWRRVGDLHSW